MRLGKLAEKHQQDFTLQSKATGDSVFHRTAGGRWAWRSCMRKGAGKDFTERVLGARRVQVFGLGL